MDALHVFRSFKSVRVLTDKLSGSSKGFGFIDIESEDSNAAQNLLDRLRGLNVEGRDVVLEVTRPAGNKSGSFANADNAYVNLYCIDTLLLLLIFTSSSTSSSPSSVVSPCVLSFSRSSTVFLGNLDMSVTVADLENHLTQFVGECLLVSLFFYLYFFLPCNHLSCLCL